MFILKLRLKGICFFLSTLYMTIIREKFHVKSVCDQLFHT